LLVLSVPPARAQLSQNSGISTADTWVTFDLVVQTQATVNNSIPFTNPQTNATATTYSLTSKPRTFHVEIGYDTSGVVVMNLWPTGTPPNPITDDTGLVSMIRFASGNITVFDQNGVAIPFSAPASNVAAFSPLSLLGSNPAPSLLTSLVVPNIVTRASAVHAALSYSTDGSQAYLSMAQPPVSNNATWTYAQAGSVWNAQQAVFQLVTPAKTSTRTLQFANIASFDNATNDAARAAKGDTITAGKAVSTATPTAIPIQSSSSCPPYLSNVGGTQNMVFQHGILSSGCTWHRMIPWLNQDFRFANELVPSLSSLSPLASQGGALISDINAAGGSGYILLGHSQGGLISRYAAQQYQAANPSQAIVKGVLTLDTPHEGAPLAALPVGFVNDVITGDATALYDELGCASAYDNFLCYIAALYFTAAGSVVQLGALSDLVPGSPFLNSLNSTQENFKRAAVIGNTPRRWIEMRIADEFILGSVCNPEDYCGERAIALDTEVTYDVLVAAFIFAELDCLFFCDDDACSFADELLGILITLDIIDLDYNFISAPDFTNGEDGIVPSPSQNYPSPTATQISISGADSHIGATKSDLARNALEEGLSQVFQVPTQASCTFSLSPTVFSTSSSATTSSFTITTGAGCQWSAVVQNSWVSITAGSSGTSSGAVDFSVLANPVSVPRSATIIVGNNSSRTIFTVQQSALCTYALSELSIALPPGGGTYAVDVTTEAGCPWTAVSNASWLTITAGPAGTGSGSFTLSATPNPGDTDLLGAITVMNQTLTVILGNPVGTPGTASVTITGSNRSVVINPCAGKGPLVELQPELSPPSCPVTIPETGTVSVIIGGQVFTASYGSTTTSAIATSLATAINYPDSRVTATVSGATISLTSSVKGAATNYSLATSYTYNTTYFSSPAFTATASGASLTGGTD
jgi:pimeloyl-ACP methyl ester carboxylesterase